MTHLDTAAAARVHYTDPRVRQLAEARWRLQAGGSKSDWLMLGKDNPNALIREARDWIRAAVAAGILPPPASTSPASDADDPETRAALVAAGRCPNCGWLTHQCNCAEHPNA